MNTFLISIQKEDKFVSTSNLLVISQNNNLHHRSMLATDAVIRNMV